jgi:hypothetical protein
MKILIFLVVLEITSNERKPSSPFKINPWWLREEEYVQMVKILWVSFNGSFGESIAIQLESKLKHVKQASITTHRET